MDDLLQESASFFGVGKIIKSEKTKHGIGNDNYFVDTDKGQFVLRVLRDQTLEGIENELVIEKQLSDGGVLTPHLIKGLDNKPFYQKDSKNVTCSKRILGNHPQNFDEKLCFKVGATLAKFHTSVKGLSVKSDGWLDRDYAKRQINQLPNGKLKSEIEKRFNESLRIYTFSLPFGIIHGDLHSNNMIVTANGQIAVFDFESSENNLFIVDIARTAMSICSENLVFKKSLLDNLLKGYRSIRKITKNEMECFYDALLYASSAIAASLFNNKDEKRAREKLIIADSWEELHVN